MIPACQADLTSKALGKCLPSQLILTLASAFLVLYLALDFVVTSFQFRIFPCNGANLNRTSWTNANYSSSVHKPYV